MKDNNVIKDFDLILAPNRDGWMLEITLINKSVVQLFLPRTITIDTPMVYHYIDIGTVNKEIYKLIQKLGMSKFMFTSYVIEYGNVEKEFKKFYELLQILK